MSVSTSPTVEASLPASAVTQTGDVGRISPLTCASAVRLCCLGRDRFSMYIRWSADCSTSSAGIPQLRPADAEAGPDPHRAAVDPDRRDDRVAQAYGEVGGVRRAEAVGEDDELVTAEPGDRVAVAHAAW